MKCPKCQFKNPAQAKFCMECGNRLELCCPNCGSVTPSIGKFCLECGHNLRKPLKTSPIYYSEPQSYTPEFLADKILTTRSSIEGERKLVTVFFADVANFTSISEKLDPEEVHRIMDGTFMILMNEIHKVEGTVNQFTGDGVMALFGAPVAHEDHALRACYASLSIQKSIQGYADIIKDGYEVDFSLRMGLNSGPVIVGSIGDDLRMDYTAIGDTANLAARMASLAKPGSIFVSSNTRKLVKNFFIFEPLGKIDVKGKDEPQEAFALINKSEVGTRIEASVAKGLTKFVGRKNSMAKIKAVSEKVRSGAGQVVGVVGEAGVGKSRFLLEFKKLLPQDEIIYLEGRCLHYGGYMAYLPILDILKSCFKITDGDQGFLIKQNIEDNIIKLDEKLQDTIPAFQELFSLKVESKDFFNLEPEQKREKTFEAIRELFIRLSQQKFLVLAIEDLHWIDKTSEEFLSYLIGWLANTRILLILLYRSEYDHQWGRKSNYTEIGLNQLGTASSTELVQALLEGGEVAPKLGQLILERAAGNPLFIEEFTHALLENGYIESKDQKYVLSHIASDIQIPENIQGLIAARIDRVEENLKQIMQVASVIGREFAYRILQSTMGINEDLKPHLYNLQSLELIYEKNLFPELEYIFKHALIQEVAYYSLLASRRKELHSKVGQAMESIFSERLSEFSSIIGGHFLQGERWERAFYFLDKAGDAAARLFAHAEARVHFAHALKALSHLENTEDNRRQRVDTIIKQTISSWRADSPEQNLKRLSEAEKLANELNITEGTSEDDRLRLARVHFWLGRVYYSRGEMPKAMQYFKQVLPIAQEAAEPELIAIPSGAIGQAMAIQGHLGKATTLLGQAISLFEKAANWPEWIQAMSFRGSAVVGMGNYAQGLSEVKLALSRAKEINSLTGISVSNNCLGFAHFFGGDLNLAIETAQAAVMAAEQSGDRIYVYIGYGLWGWAAGRAGQLEVATDCMARSQEVAQELGGQIIMADVFTTAKAEIALNMKCFDEALGLAKRAVNIAQKMGGIWGEGIGRRVWGQALIALASPNWKQADRQMAASLRVLESGQNLIEMARTRVAWGAVYHDRRNFAAAHDNWEQAAAQFQASGTTRELEEVCALLADA